MIQKALRTAQHYLPGGRDRREAISRSIQRLHGRPHEPDYAALRHFPRGKLLLDVGCNYGQSIGSMLLMQPEATIVSFEPNAELAAKVGKLFRADPRVTVRPYGLSDAAGVFDLFVPYYGNFAYPGLASVIEDTARSWLSSETLFFFRSSNVHTRRISCRLETLDSQNLEPYFIKIDVQGAEYSVLRGGQATLSQSKPILLVETGGDQRICSLLGGLGYSEYEFIRGKFIQQQSKGVNSFFMTDAHRDELMSCNSDLFVTAKR